MSPWRVTRTTPTPTSTSGISGISFLLSDMMEYLPSRRIHREHGSIPYICKPQHEGTMRGMPRTGDNGYRTHALIGIGSDTHEAEGCSNISLDTAFPSGYGPPRLCTITDQCTRRYGGALPASQWHIYATLKRIRYSPRRELSPAI